MAYSNSSLQIHGPGCLAYTARPSYYVSINVSDVSRSGSTISCTVNASLNGLGGSSYCGYNIHLYAQLDDGSLVEIVSKGNTPSQWSDGYGSLGTQTISSTNTTTSCTLNLWLSSNSPDHGGAQRIVQSISLSSPPLAKHTLTLIAGTGVASFTGGGRYDDKTYATSTAIASPGYALTKYVGDSWDASETQTWTECANKSKHVDTWYMGADRTITAYAEPSRYTVSYHANGGSGTMAASTATYGQNFLTRQNTFSRSGWTFTGWNEKADGTGVAWNLNSPGVYEYGVPWVWTYKYNIVLYAQWRRMNYNVDYNANGGSQPPESQIKYQGIDLTLTSSIPDVAKKVTLTFNPNGGNVNPKSSSKYCGFRSWNTKANNTGTSYASGSIYKANQDVTLYAQWSTVAFSLPTPARSDCIFVGWYSAIDGGDKITDRTVFSQNTTVYARWDYNVHYNLNGGYVGDDSSYGGTIPDTVKHHNQNLTLTNTKPCKEGLTFIGWSTSPTGSVNYVQGSVYRKNEPVTLYAIYDVPSFTVTFDLRGGTYTGGELVQKVKYGQNATLPNDPTKAENQFKGWIGEYTNVTHDVTIYALWNGSPVWIVKSDKKWHSYLD